jgi:Uri superfamily endonuclease
VQVPVTGFGSSDCRTCPSHLVRIPDSLDETTLSGLITA